MAIIVTRKELDQILDRLGQEPIKLPLPPVLVVPGVPTLVRADRGDGWWEGEFWHYRPASKNLKTSRWAWVKARKADDAVIALWRFARFGPTEATGKRRVKCWVFRKRTQGRLPDEINLVESLADALVANGILVDDSGKWMEFDTPIVGVDGSAKANWVTIIRVEDCS